MKTYKPFIFNFNLNNRPKSVRVLYSVNKYYLFVSNNNQATDDDYYELGAYYNRDELMADLKANGLTDYQWVRG